MDTFLIADHMNVIFKSHYIEGYTLLDMFGDQTIKDIDFIYNVSIPFETQLMNLI